jgi:hypothetical protein
MWFVFICVCNTVGLARINTWFVLLDTDCKYCEAWFFWREMVVVFFFLSLRYKFLGMWVRFGTCYRMSQSATWQKKEWYGRKSDTCVDFEEGICSESSPIAVLNFRIMLPLCMCVCVCVCVCVHVCISLQFIFGLLYISPLYRSLWVSTLLKCQIASI